jgi:hypothetical protein
LWTLGSGAYRQTILATLSLKTKAENESSLRLHGQVFCRGTGVR